jgi:hypothetical protein
MEPVTIALALAKAAGVDDWLKEKISGTVTGKVASKVIEFAKQATGKDTPEEALEAVNGSPGHAHNFRNMVLENEHALKMAAYEDRKDARQTYRIHPQQADKIAERVMRYNLPFIVGLVIINCVVLHFFRDDAALLAAVSNVLGMAIKSLFDERKEVTGFYFGGSMDASERER